jgi:selenocysteine-specific elongation factor
VGQEVEILPQGLKARIRGLQTHKQKIEEALPGSRVAINLTGVSTDRLGRGDVVTAPGWLEPTELIDVNLQLLSGIPKTPKHNVEVEFFSGTSQIMARIHLLGAEHITPGGKGWARLRLAQPTAVVKKDRFIIRQPSPSLTIGGGVIADSHPQRLHRRFRPEVINRLETLSYGTPEEIMLEVLRRQEPCPAKEFIQCSGLSKEVAQEALDQLLKKGQILILTAEGREMDLQALATSAHSLISASGWAALVNGMTGLLREFHRQYPLRAGMSQGELMSRLQLETRFFNEVVDLAVRQGKVALTEATLRLPEHEVHFNPEQQRQIGHLLTAFGRNPNNPPTVAEAERMVGEEVFNALIKQGVLVKVSDEICFLSQVYEGMVRRVVDYIKRKGRITIGDARDMFGSSRKYILPFLEYLDDRRVTRRVGDERVLGR